MQPNSYDSYSDINKSNNSAVAIILEYMEQETLDDIFQTSHLKNQFARNYSETKKELFSQSNNIDFKFCTFQNLIIKTLDAQEQTTYQAPTNFIRFLRNDKRKNNQMIISKSNSEGIQSLYSGNFYYIGYVKDSNPEIQIPDDFMVMLASSMLTSKKIFTDRLSPIDLRNLNIKYLTALARLKDSYL